MQRSVHHNFFYLMDILQIENTTYLTVCTIVFCIHSLFEILEIILCYKYEKLYPTKRMIYKFLKFHLYLNTFCKWTVFFDIQAGDTLTTFFILLKFSVVGYVYSNMRINGFMQESTHHDVLKK